MDRRGFLRAAGILTGAACVPLPMVPAAGALVSCPAELRTVALPPFLDLRKYRGWRNYTFTYCPIDKTEVIEKVLACLGKGDE